MKTAKNIQTVSKGYRLKPTTHNLIKRIQTQLSSTQEKVISSALKLYYVTIKNANPKALNGNILNK